MGGVFISYRRDDSRGSAGRLYDDLADRFGSDVVFRDLDALRPGAVYGNVIHTAIAGCDALIAVMGSNWVDARAEDGERRLDNPKDLVRSEIATALAQNKIVIPVLVEDARMPSEAQLPTDLAPLVSRNALLISDHRWDYDVGRLVALLEDIVGPARASTHAPHDTPTPIRTVASVEPSVQAASMPPAIASKRPVVQLAIVVMALIAAGAFAAGRRSVIPTSLTEVSTNGPSAIPSRPESQPRELSYEADGVPVQKTVWYWGFKVTFERATLHRVDGERMLDVTATLENQGDGTVGLDRAIEVTSNSRSHELAYRSDLPNVPGKATGKGRFSFKVGTDFTLANAVITLGRSDKNQAVVPLGAAGRLTTLQPLAVTFTTRTLSAGALTLEVRAGELRADRPGVAAHEYAQIARGHRLLILDFASVGTTAQYGYNVFDRNIVVQLPDGTTVAADGLNVAPYLDKPVRDFSAQYVVNDPPEGGYVLILRDTSGTKPTAAADFKVG